MSLISKFVCVDNVVPEESVAYGQVTCTIFPSFFSSFFYQLNMFCLETFMIKVPYRCRGWMMHMKYKYYFNVCYIKHV